MIYSITLIYPHKYVGGMGREVLNFAYESNVLGNLVAVCVFISYGSGCSQRISFV